MKKVIAMVVCVAMLACFALTASAATKATFTVSTVENAKKGDIVLVDVTIAEKQTKIGTLAVKFTYDTEKLAFVMNEDEGKYFVTGEGAGGATAAGNEANMEVQMATADGFWKAGKVLTLAFEVIADIAEGEIAAVEMALLDQPTHCDDNTVTYDVEIINGGVKGVAKEEPKDPKPPVDGGKDPVEPQDKPVVDKPVVDEEVEDVTVTDTEANPETGDVSGIAVAAGLCAVMAAAFVITKKVND